MKNIEISERVEKDCEEFELICADEKCLVYIEGLAINHKQTEPSEAQTDGEKVADDIYILEKGNRVWLKRELQRQMLISCRLRTVEVGNDEDIDFLVQIIKALGQEKNVAAQQIMNYRHEKNEALDAYDMAQARRLGKMIIPRNVVSRVINKVKR